MRNEDTVIVFTARSPQRILREGGSQAWVLNPVRAKACQWLVCTQNQHHPDHTFSDATEFHGSAFLVGKIAGVIPSPEGDRRDERWLIQISEYALIKKLHIWQRWRNPVRYSSLNDLGIHPADLDFQKMPLSEPMTLPTDEAHPVTQQWPPRTLTIPEAKVALAATFGVTPEAVEIVIRG